MDEDAALAQTFAVVLPQLNDRQRRVLLAAEVGALGPGSVTRVAHAPAVSRATVSKAVAEARHPAAADDRVRRSGGGRKRLAERDPGLIGALEALVAPQRRRDLSTSPRGIHLRRRWGQQRVSSQALEVGTWALGY